MSRRILVWAAVTALLLATGCSADGGASPASEPTSAVAITGCDLLSRPIDLPRPDPDDLRPGPATADVVEAALASGQGSTSLVAIYLDPPLGDAQLGALAAEVEAYDGVHAVRALDREATFAAFQRLFAGDEQMLDRVRPEDLPLSVVAIVDATSVEAVLDWADDRAGTFEAREVWDEHVADDLAGWLVREHDRTVLRNLAADLRRVDGSPAWATVAAEAIDRSLEDGITTIELPEADVDAAVVAYEELQATC